jgi:hypothetical protein
VQSELKLFQIDRNGYKGGWPSARLLGWSAADWSRPATNKSINSEREKVQCPKKGNYK